MFSAPKTPVCLALNLPGAYLGSGIAGGARPASRPVLTGYMWGHWDQLPGDRLAHVSLIWTRVGQQG